MRRPGLPTALLWPAAVLGLISMLGSLILVVPHDFWWHMKVGEVISSTGSIPQHDTFSYTRFGAPFVYQSWLSELLFYQLYRLGGLALIVITRNLLLLGMYGLTAWHAYRRSGSAGLAALGVLVAACLAVNNWTVRPQTFSWVLFATCWLVLSGYTGGWLRARWLVLLPALELLWANLHGAFTLGLVLAGLVATGETIQALAELKLPPAQGRVGALLRPTLWRTQLRPLAPLWLALLAMLLASLVNPLGFGLYAYVQTLLSDPASQQLVIEWQSPTPQQPLGLLFFGSLVLMLVLWLRRPAAGRLSHLLVFLAFTWLALTGIRYLLWYGLVLGPLLAQLLARPRPQGQRAPRETPLQHRLNLLLLVILFLPSLLFQPGLRRYAPVPQPFAGNPAPHPEAALVTADTPLQAVRFLREQPVGRRLYHDMSYGSYLIWAFGGDPPVFADPRVELYPLSFWLDYRNIGRGCNYNQLLDNYQIDALLLNRYNQDALIAQLEDDPGWEQVYADDQSLIFRRQPGRTGKAAGACGGPT